MNQPSCRHTYGYAKGSLLEHSNYKAYSIYEVVKFTYCPWCRVQLHTLDGIALGKPEVDEDCVKGGCED